MTSNNSRMTVLRGDITKLDVDAIVNAANSSLAGGGGVDGAIHRAAGPELLEECLAIGGCPTGEARITKGYLLPAQHVIHTVGPVYDDGESGEAIALANCYRNSLDLASQHDLRSVAFPCISTGIYGYPFEAAAKIATDTIQDWLDNHSLPEKIIFCCFSEQDEAIYRSILQC